MTTTAKAIDIRSVVRGITGRTLADALSGGHRDMLRNGHDIAQSAARGSSVFDPTDPEVRKILDEGGERIVGILDATREAVRRKLERAIRDGDTSVDSLARMIADDPIFSRRRARTIARTETATMLNRGTLHGYRTSGRVTQVECFDSSDCGLRGHDDAEKPAGKLYPLKVAEEHPLGHVNCQRAWAPVVDLG